MAAIPVHLCCDRLGGAWEEDSKTVLLSRYGASVQCSHPANPANAWKSSDLTRAKKPKCASPGNAPRIVTLFGSGWSFWIATISGDWTGPRLKKRDRQARPERRDCIPIEAPQ